MKLRKIQGNRPNSCIGVTIQFEDQEHPKVINSVIVMHCLRFDVHKEKELIGDLSLEIINEIRKAFNKPSVDIEGNIK